MPRSEVFEFLLSRTGVVHFRRPDTDWSVCGNVTESNARKVQHYGDEAHVCALCRRHVALRYGEDPLSPEHPPGSGGELAVFVHITGRAEDETNLRQLLEFVHRMRPYAKEVVTACEVRIEEPTDNP